MNHAFKIGDKINARRNNGNIIEGEIKCLFEKKASVFWYEENVYHFRKFFYYEMTKSILINQNPGYQRTNNHILYSNKWAHSCCLESLKIVAIIFISMFCFFFFLIFVIGVFQTYENSSIVVLY